MIALIAFLVILPLSSMFSGWILSIIWAWFAVPLGASSIGIAQAIGISLLACAIRSPNNTEDNDKTIGERMLEAVIKTVLTGFFILLMGYIVLQFMPSAG